MYQVGNDIQPGVYVGLADTDAFGSCYWARLSGASGDFSELISNENAIGQFYVEIKPDDKYFKVDCEITPLNDWPTPEPKTSLGPGMYQVGNDIQPGVYAGLADTDAFGSCYWARLSGASGDFSELISNENAIGQFYVEIKPDDRYYKVDCEITPLDDWPTPVEPLSEIEPGLYLVGRDIKPGTYRGKAGTDALSSCYWARLSGLSGDFGHLIANDNATGQFFVTVTPSDLALSTSCKLTLAE